MQNFRLLTTHVKFHQICTLIGSLKYIEFQLRRTEELYLMTLKIDAKFEDKLIFCFKKWQELGKIWPEHSQVSKACNFIYCYCAKYLMFDLKNYGEVLFHDTEGWCKIWRKTDMWFGKWHEEYGKFSPENLKISKLRFWWDPLIQSRKVWA